MDTAPVTAGAMARAFRGANEHDTNTYLRMHAAGALFISKMENFMFAVEARWMCKAWPLLSGQWGDNNSNNDDEGDWRQEIGSIENAPLCVTTSLTAANNAAISSDEADDTNNPSVRQAKQARSTHRLRDDVKHGVDFFLVGPSVWMLIATKFGFDVELKLPIVDDPAIFHMYAVQIQNDHPDPYKCKKVAIPLSGSYHYNTMISELQEDGTAKQKSHQGSKANNMVVAAAASKPGNVSDDEDETMENREDDLFPGDEDATAPLPSSYDTRLAQPRNPNEPVILMPSTMSATTDASILDKDTNDSPWYVKDNAMDQEDTVGVSSWTPEVPPGMTVLPSNLVLEPGTAVSPGTILLPEQMTVLLNRYGAGLGNLGNTCFMNSTLQCLVHTAPLRNYFLSGDFRKDLNEDNPLGTGGDMAIQFEKVMREIWGAVPSAGRTLQSLYENSYVKGNSFLTTGSAVYPRQFKQTLGKHAEQFIGYDQHDSQELATYLLDALHEDTNRVTKKPYVEKPEQGENETDEAAADKAWKLHCQREDSMILEYFTGQVKSRVQCCKESCGRVSTTFDPFMYLSVPIPGATERQVKVTFVPLNPTIRPQEIKVKVTRTATIKELKQALMDDLKRYGVVTEEETNARSEDLCAVDIWDKTVYDWHDDEASVEKIRDNDNTFIYQLRPLVELQGRVYESDEQELADFYKRMEMRQMPEPFSTMDDDSNFYITRGENWKTVLSRYLLSPTGAMSAFHPKRGRLEDMVLWYNKLASFMDMCYKAGKGEEQLHNRSFETDPVLEDIQNISDQSSTFKDVKSFHDYNLLYYVVEKMRRTISLRRPKVKRITVNMGSGFDLPLIVRIPTDMTVYGLREELAKRLAPALKNGREQISSSAPGESTSERASNEVTESSGDHLSSCFGSPEMLVLRQVPLTCSSKEPGYGNNSTDTKKIGVLEKEGMRNVGSRPVSLATASDDEEQELVSYLVDDCGTLNLEWSEEFLKQNVDKKTFNLIDRPKPPYDREASESNSDALNVLTCIDKYCHMEQLEESEMWYCSSCKEHVRAWKQFHIYRSPPILIVHLKRFQYSALTHRRDKIDSFVDFPLEGLDLTQQVMHWTDDTRPIYDCYAVSNHYGGMGGGHYTAHALNDDGVWCYYDDSHVSTNVDPKEVVSSAAYVLYYRRRDVSLGGDSLITMQMLDEKLPPAMRNRVIGRSGGGDDVSSSNAAMVDEDEGLDVDMASRSTSPMGSIDGTADQFDTEYGHDQFDPNESGGMHDDDDDRFLLQ